MTYKINISLYGHYFICYLQVVKMASNRLILVLFVFAGVFAVGYTDCKSKWLVIHLNNYYCNIYFQL